MPDAPRSPRLPFDGIEEIAAATRRQGGRITAPRRQLLEVLFAAEGPMSAESLARALTDRGTEMELSSIYRSLEALEQLGAVRHVHIGHGPGLYALTGRAEREYLTCERCGRVTAVDAVELDPVRDLIRELTGYEARFTHFPIIGLCASCAAEHSTGPAAPGGHGHSHGPATT
jgi:Fur family ferric uptake transcriptional regulator